MTWDRELNLAVAAARQAADLLRRSFVKDAQIRSEQGRDIKTGADVAAEHEILECLSPSTIAVLAEESAESTEVQSGVKWIVDPLDGTMNFSRGFPMHAVSIGLWDGNVPILGVVLDIARNACFSGIVGRGAHRDGVSISVSRTSEPGRAILATGFPVGADYSTLAVHSFVTRVQSFKKVRMIGSAALSLAYVAAGAFDAYSEADIMLWDVAAGCAIVAAAGGQVRIRPGRETLSVIVSASNGLLKI